MLVVRFIFFIIIISVSAGAFSQEENAKGTQCNSNCIKRGTDKFPVFITGEVTTKKTEQEAAEDAAASNVKSVADNALIVGTERVALFTFALFLVALVQIFLFWYQLRLIRESLLDTKEAADAAKISADAAKQTVETMKDTAQRQLRAYIGVKTEKHPTVVGSKITDAILTIINSGQTPAYQVRPWTFMTVVGREGITDAFNVANSMDKTNQSRTTLHQGGESEIVISFPRTLTTEEIKGIYEKKIRIYICGDITYLDVFGIERNTRFCRFLARPSDDSAEKLHSAEEHNEAT